MKATALDIDEFAVSGDGIDARADELVQWWVEGLQCGDRGDGDRLYDATARMLAEEPGKRVNLGKLRHPVIVSLAGDIATC